MNNTTTISHERTVRNYNIRCKYYEFQSNVYIEIKVDNMDSLYKYIMNDLFINKYNNIVDMSQMYNILTTTTVNIEEPGECMNILFNNLIHIKLLNEPIPYVEKLEMQVKKLNKQVDFLMFYVVRNISIKYDELDNKTIRIDSKEINILPRLDVLFNCDDILTVHIDMPKLTIY